MSEGWNETSTTSVEFHWPVSDRDQELTGFYPQEVDVGLAADVGTLQRLPRVVGNQRWVGKPGGRDRRASLDLE